MSEKQSAEKLPKGRELLDGLAEAVKDAFAGSPIHAGIIGATGYAGVELVRLLLNHPGVKLSAISSVSFEGKAISEVYPSLYSICDMVLTSEDDVIEKSDVVFTSLPSGLSEKIAKKCQEKEVSLIDLGADFRLGDETDYKQWYGAGYAEPGLHQNAVYCIPELHRDRITADVDIIGNPGCYPTSIGLGIAPVVKAGLAAADGIVIDSKSGVTGAGRSLTQNTHFPDCNESFAPYKVAAHRHTPEIEQTLSELAGEKITVTFVPHLLPVSRGIVSTMYISLKENTNIEKIYELYNEFYKNEQFVRILPLGMTANLKRVAYSNYCDISLHLDGRANRLIVVSTIDNMVKGAAGQAVQNMNLLFGLRENMGLNLIPPAI